MSEYVTVPGMAVEPCFKVKVDVVIVDASISSLKVTVTIELTATSVALFAGLVELTVGGVVSGTVPVVKLQL